MPGVIDVFLIVNKDARFSEGLNKMSDLVHEYCDSPLDAADMLTYCLASIFAASLKNKNKEGLDQTVEAVGNGVYNAVAQMWKARGIDIPLKK